MSTKLLLLILLIFLSASFKIQTYGRPMKHKKGLTTEKMPQYLGKSYHLIKGNPYSNKIDEGFKATIFEFTYTKGLTTEDGKYTIPDNTHSTESTACSLDAKSYKYSGTQKYQESLQNTISIDTKTSVLFFKASFSMSTTFSEFS